MDSSSTQVRALEPRFREDDSHGVILAEARTGPASRCNMGEKVIGVLGGMGPEATAAFFLRIIRATEVRRDQDHFRVLIDSNPKIPDRTAAIRGEGESPLPMLIEGARGLRKAGADFIAIPCVTAHCFLTPLRRKVRIPILDIVAEVVGHVRRMKNVRRIGIVATSGTVDAGLFQKAFAQAGIEVEIGRASCRERVYLCV